MSNEIALLLAICDKMGLQVEQAPDTTRHPATEAEHDEYHRALSSSVNRPPWVVCRTEDGRFEKWLDSSSRGFSVTDRPPAPDAIDGLVEWLCSNGMQGAKFRSQVDKYRQSRVGDEAKRDRLTVPSCTSGYPLQAELMQVSRVREFFGMRSVKLNVYRQGMRGAPFKWSWSEGWYHPSEITGY